MGKVNKLLIVAGESSGELYGALLAREVFSRYPGVTIKGVGGARMREESVDIIAPISSAFGLTEAIRGLKNIRTTFQLLKELMDKDRPDIVVPIDYPDFNFKVATEAKKRNIPVLYYVSPQVWAWRPKRVHTIGKISDMIALILPFESAIYSEASVRHEFVGHPAIDEIELYLRQRGMGLASISESAFKVSMKRALDVDQETLVALLPGSRRHEIEKLLPVIINSALQLMNEHREIRFIMPVAANLDRDTQTFIDNWVKPLGNDIIVLRGNSIGALAAADFGIIASGTASFQAALLNVPMVVIYKVSALSYFIGRLIIKVNHIALADVLLEKCYPEDNPLMIREYIQSDVKEQNIVAEINRLMGDIDYYREMLLSFDRVRRLFVDKRASKRVSEILGELVH